MAIQWSYRGGSSHEQSGFKNRSGAGGSAKWSGDPADYDPLCDTCHAARDKRPAAGKGYRLDAGARQEFLRRKREKAREEYARDRVVRPYHRATTKHR